jgi:nitrate/nitrite transport system substrate-binding protein
MKDIDLDVRETASDAAGYPAFEIMGRRFDPASPQAYLDQFAIKRTQGPTP